MPTLPQRAPKLVTDDVDYDSQMANCFGMIANTAIFDCTGHPAMNIPIAKVDDLPIGMMLVSKH